MLLAIVLVPTPPPSPHTHTLIPQALQQRRFYQVLMRHCSGLRTHTHPYCALTHPYCARTSLLRAHIPTNTFWLRDVECK
jgi:hypothetical protein